MRRKKGGERAVPVQGQMLDGRARPPFQACCLRGAQITGAKLSGEVARTQGW